MKTKSKRVSTYDVASKLLPFYKIGLLIAAKTNTHDVEVFLRPKDRAVNERDLSDLRKHCEHVVTRSGGSYYIRLKGTWHPAVSSVLLRSICDGVTYKDYREKR